MIQQKILRDPATALIRTMIELSGGAARLEEHGGRSWASATFAGMRHSMRLSFAGAGVSRGEWLASILPEHEFTLPGHILADIAIVEMHRREEGEPALTLEIEALTVEDC
ncbi:MAG: hypothetical protein R3E02_00670 [Blastomonas sp.]